jgi:very-short-patch-repair endonuclease
VTFQYKKNNNIFDSPPTVTYSASDTYFNKILSQLPKEIHSNVFFDSKNSEYFFAKKRHKTVFVDFFIASSKKVIEFAGDYWHGNPKVYEPDFYNHQAKSLAKELYQKTIERNLFLENVHGCKVLLVWENEYKKNKEETLDKCLKFLNE